jgi:hypothetical protein
MVGRKQGHGQTQVVKKGTPKHCFLRLARGGQKGVPAWQPELACFQRQDFGISLVTGNTFEPALTIGASSFEVQLPKFWLRHSVCLERSARCKSAADERDSASKSFRCVYVANAGHVLVSVALSHRAHPRPQTIQVSARTATPVVAGQIADTYPNHPHLHCEYRQLQQRTELVAALGR